MRKFFKTLTTLMVVVALIVTMPAIMPVTAAAAGATALASDDFSSINPDWHTDRYEPDAFASTQFSGDNRLQIQIGSAGAVAQRAASYSGVFYDTQGRQKALDIKNVYPWMASAKLYISDDMLTGNTLRRTDLWIVSKDNASNEVTSYPIVGMRRFDPSDARNPGAGNISTIWRYWYERSDTDSGWTDTTLPVTAGWHTLSIIGGKHEFRYFIDGADIGGYSISADSYPGAVIMQAYNFGVAGETRDATVWTDGSKNYSVYWDDFKVEDLSPSYIPVNPAWTDGQLVKLDDGSWVQVGYNAFRTISAAINYATTGKEIRVAAGTYNEDVVVNKAITLKGAGANQSIISGPIGGSVNTLDIAASGAVVDGFTITRDGNNTTDWNNSGLNSQGVVFSGDGNTLQNCKVLGNRNGVYINNRLNNKVLNNIITNNRTGVQVCNRINGTVFTGNQITDNFTMGILFNFDGAGDLATNASVTINNNIISGNWYGELKCRWTNSTQILDLTKNWLGSTNITRSATELAEPAYTAQIPVIFGGTATKPTQAAPIISGPTYTKINAFPWYTDEAMTTLATLDQDIWVDDGFTGAIGDYITLPNGHVAIVGTNAFGNIQEAVKAVTAGQTIKVFPGNYPVTYSSYAGSSWYLYVDKDNVTIMGVDASGVPITGRPGKTTELPVIYGDGYTGNGNWGTQTLMIVTGDNFKLQGMEVMPKVTINKTIELSGENAIVQYCRLSGNTKNLAALNDGGWDLSRDGTLYIGEQSKTITKYKVDNNYILNTTIAINNGAGLTGPASNRLITNNIIDGFATDIDTTDSTNIWTYYAIGFKGLDYSGWRVKDVGEAIITGNDFINCNPYGCQDDYAGGVYILSSGKNDGTSHALQLDWASIIANNTFNNGRGTGIAYSKEAGGTPLIKTYSYPYGTGKTVDIMVLAPTISTSSVFASSSDTLHLDIGDTTFETPKSNITSLLGTSGMDVYFGNGAVPLAEAAKLDAFVTEGPLYNSTACSFALTGKLVNHDGSETNIPTTDENMKVTVALSSGEAALVGDFTRSALAYYDVASDSFKTLPCTYDASTKTLTFNTKHLTTYAIVKYTQNRSFKLEPTNVSSTAAAADTGIGVPAAQAGATNYNLQIGTLYAISGKATNETDSALTGTRTTTVTVTSVVAPTSENFKVFHWADRGMDGSSPGLWISLPLSWTHTGANQYETTLSSALNYGQPMAAGAISDGPFAFKIDNAAVVQIDSIVKSGANTLSNEMVQTITVNPAQNRSFSLETADVNSAAIAKQTDMGPVSAQPKATSFSLQTGTLYAISGKATNMTAGALPASRTTTLTLTSLVAPSSSNFKVYHWAEKGLDGHSIGIWLPLTLTWAPSGVYQYTATISGALNYGEALLAGAETDGPFAFSINNPSSVVVSSVVKDGSGNVLSNEMVQTITINADSNNKLASMTKTAGSIDPAFNAETTSYTVALDKNTASTTLTAATQSPFATLYANGEKRNDITVDLQPGQSTTVWFFVIAQNGAGKTYYVKVERAKDDNKDLGSLTTTAGTLSPTFSAGATSYNLALDRTTGSTTISASSASTLASLSVDGTAGNSKTVLLANGGSQAVVFQVTAQNGDTKSYTVNVTRAVYGSIRFTCKDTSGAAYPGVGIAVYSDAALTQPVGSGTSDASGVVAVGGLDTATYWVTVTSVPAGYKLPSVKIPVSAQDGKTVETTLTLDKTLTYAYSSWQLRAIAVSSGAVLSPAFNPDVKKYTVTMDENTSKVILTPTLADAASKLYIGGRRVTSKTITLNPGGKTTVTIKVQPKTGKSFSYTVTVIRAKSTNADLANLTTSKETLQPVFAKGTTAYTLNLTNTQSSVKVTPKLADRYAKYSYTINGKHASGTVTLKRGETKTLAITVKAQAGNTKTYSITISRAS